MVPGRWPHVNISGQGPGLDPDPRSCLRTVLIVSSPLAQPEMCIGPCCSFSLCLSSQLSFFGLSCLAFCLPIHSVVLRYMFYDSFIAVFVNTLYPPPLLLIQDMPMLAG